MPEASLVAFHREGTCAFITLQNERALNALTLPMIHAIAPQLEAWRGDDSVACIVIEGAGERAFCAGGDVRAVAQASRAGDTDLTRAFFWHEYRLNQAIATLEKPFIALLDGVTMGGGVGLSAHGAIQVATERTLWAMPETAIGFFPDVGASHVLNRLGPALGAFLALSGWRLSAGDLIALNLATHYVSSARLADLKAALAHGGTPAAAIVDTFTTSAPDAALLEQMSVIDAAFTASTVEEILLVLRQEGGAFAAKVAETIERMSPTSCKVALEQLHRTRGLDLAACLRLEFAMSQHLVAGHDFYEGIRAVLIDKDQSPVWQPATLAEVSAADVDACFAPLGRGALSFDPAARP